MSNEEVLNSLLKDKLEDAGIESKSTGTDEIVCIVDRSGSMQSIRADAEGGLNTFIEDQKKVGKANLTIVEFDNSVDIVCEQVDINEAETYNLSPRGATALLDAIGSVIGDVDKYTSKDGKTIIVVLTDGGENASKEWKHDAIFDMISERKEAGWEFMFLASGQDAIKVGAAYGFDANSTVSFADNGDGAAAAYAVSSVYTASLRSMAKSDALLQKSSFVQSLVKLPPDVFMRIIHVRLTVSRLMTAAERTITGLPAAGSSLML